MNADRGHAAETNPVVCAYTFLRERPTFVERWRTESEALGIPLYNRATIAQMKSGKARVFRPGHINPDNFLPEPQEFDTYYAAFDYLQAYLLAVKEKMQR